MKSKRMETEQPVTSVVESSEDDLSIYEAELPNDAEVLTDSDEIESEELTDDDDEELSEAVGAQRPETFIHYYYPRQKDYPLTLFQMGTVFLAVIVYAWVVAFQLEQFRRTCRC
jgi:hypothetical protein